MEPARIRGARGGGGGGNKWKALKRRLGCCGGSWAFHGSFPELWMPEEEGTEGGAAGTETAGADGTGDGGGLGCDDEIRGATPATTAAMNLAAALAAERQFRSASAQPQRTQDRAAEEQGEGGAPAARASLMALMAEGGGAAAEAEEAWWCCVCLGQRKGAAFIPCGHTLCRVCSREVWLNRGTCPLCNRRILDVLDIF